MTSNTTYRQKGRAVFLAAIMVLSMVAGAAVLTGSAAANHDPGSSEVDIDDLDDGTTDRFWQGQTIEITNLDNNEEVDIYDSDGNLVRERQATGTSLNISTTSLGAGTYDVQPLGGNNNPGNFTIAVQEFYEASFASDSTNQGTVDLTLDSNRRGYNVTVGADGLTTADLQGVFDGADIVHNDTDADTVTLNAPDGVQTWSANFSAVDAGNYTFDFDVVDTTASASANITVNEPADSDATFASQSASTVVGDEASIDIETSGEPDEVWLNVSDDGGYYDGTIHLDNIDYSEDSTISLTWNTHNASDAATLGFSATDADVGVDYEDGAAIDADYLANQSASYTFESFVQDPTVDGEFRDVASVRVNTRSTGSTAIWTAPQSVAHDNGNITAIVNQATQDSSIAKDDLVLVQVQATGLYGYMADDVANFNETGGLNMTITEDAAGPYETGDSLDIQNLSNSAQLYKQPGEGQFYVAIDSGNVANFSADSSWDAEFSIGAGNPYVSEEQTSSASFDVAERSVEITGDINENDTLMLPADSEAELTADSNVAPGTAVNVRMNFPFEFVSTSGEVGEDGTFSSTVDLSSFAEGTQFSTRVRAPGANTEAQVESVVGSAGTAAPSFGISATATETAEVDGEAQISYTITNEGDADGTVEYTVSVDGEEVDSGSTELAAGSSTSPMSYTFDTASAGDIEWTVETQHDSEDGTLTVTEPSDTGGDDTGGDDTGGDDTGGDDTGGDDTGGNTTDTGGDDDGDSDDGGQPGFGLIVALFALIGAALLALRRQN